MQLSKWPRATTGFALPGRACSTSAASTNFTRNSIENKFATTISSRRHRSGFAIDERRPDHDPLQWPAWTAYHADAGEPTPVMTGSTTTGMKSYVPSSRSIASSKEHTNVEPRIFTRADSFVKNSYTSGVTLWSPCERQRTRIRAGGIFVAPETSSIAAFSACRSAKVGARSNAFTNTAKPAEPRLVIRHKVEDCRRTYASNE